MLRGPVSCGAFPEQACLTGVWPGALGSCCLEDRMWPAEAHELCAAPQRLPQSSSLLTEAPFALPEARQAQHSQGLPRRHPAEPPEAGLHWAEVGPARGGARANNTQKAGTRRAGTRKTKRWGVAVNTCGWRRLREPAGQPSGLRSCNPHRPGLETGLGSPAAPEGGGTAGSHYCDLHPATEHFPRCPQGAAVGHGAGEAA